MRKKKKHKKTSNQTGLGSREKSIFAAPCKSDGAREGKEKLLQEAFVVEEEENVKFGKQSLHNKPKPSKTERLQE